MKRLLAALAILAAAMTTHALAAGTIPFSGQQQFDSQGRPLSGGKLYTFQSGTSTPLTVYQDSALTVVHPNPMTLDSSGRIPFFYAPDGSLKFRLADVAGVTVTAGDFVLVIGPSSGAGAGAGVDATTVLATGDVKARYSTGSLTGFVRLNGRTIGSATSGASERANADVQSLFEFLWTTDANLTVSSGRGATANADWLANKTIALPDFRGRVPGALDDMGNSAAGRLTASFFGSAATALGVANGAESRTLTIAQLPAVTPAGSVSVGLNDPGHGHPTLMSSSANADDSTGGIRVDAQNTASFGAFTGAPTTTLGQQIGGNTTGITVSSQTFTGTPFGSGTAHATVQPTILITYYIKL